MKRFCISFIFLVLAGFALFGEPLSFTYAFLTKTAAGKISTLSPDLAEIGLDQTDTLKIFIKPGQSAYIYLFLHDSDDGLYLLFPERISDFDCCYRFNTAYTYPAGENWTALSGAGTERFFLLVSAKRLLQLEKAAKEYSEKLSASQRNAGKNADHAITEARSGLLERINTERLEHAGLPGVKEKLVVIAGEFRGAGDNANVTGLLVNTGDFYFKTFRIRHGAGENR